jgi:hypothetical protein
LRQRQPARSDGEQRQDGDHEAKTNAARVPREDLSSGPVEQQET